MATGKGTAKPGFANRTGQVVMRRTGARGIDHLQYVYELEWKRRGRR